MPKRKKIIRAGRITYAIIYTAPIPSDAPHIRAEKMKHSTAARQRTNFKQARQKLELLIACNFELNDGFWTLTYSDEHLPVDRKEADKVIHKFIRKLRAARRAAGQEELKYIYVTESKHEHGRLHHHILINGTGDDLNQIRSIWTWGAVQLEPLDLYGYEGLAKYMTKESEEGKPVGARTWRQSRGLKRPEVDTSWCDDSESIVVPPGCIVLANESQTTEFGSHVFIKYLTPRYKPRKTRPPRRKKNE